MKKINDLCVLASVEGLYGQKFYDEWTHVKVYSLTSEGLRMQIEFHGKKYRADIKEPVSGAYKFEYMAGGRVSLHNHTPIVGDEKNIEVVIIKFGDSIQSVWLNFPEDHKRSQAFIMHDRPFKIFGN